MKLKIIDKHGTTTKILTRDWDIVPQIGETVHLLSKHGDEIHNTYYTVVNVVYSDACQYFEKVAIIISIIANTNI